MTTSCVGDEARALEDALRRHRAELAPAFRRALADGPPAEDVQAVRRAAEARQTALAPFPLAEYRIEGVSADALARHARTTPRDFANDQVQRYVTGYRSNAIAGLGIVGGSADRALLARYAEPAGRSAGAGGGGSQEGPRPPVSAGRKLPPLDGANGRGGHRGPRHASRPQRAATAAARFNTRRSDEPHPSIEGTGACHGNRRRNRAPTPATNWFMAILFLLAAAGVWWWFRGSLNYDFNSPNFNPLGLVPVAFAAIGLWNLVPAIRGTLVSRKFAGTTFEMDGGGSVMLGETLTGRIRTQPTWRRRRTTSSRSSASRRSRTRRRRISSRPPRITRAGRPRATSPPHRSARRRASPWSSAFRRPRSRSATSAPRAACAGFWRPRRRCQAPTSPRYFPSTSARSAADVRPRKLARPGARRCGDTRRGIATQT